LKKFSKGHHSSLNELNITPLLDLAFVLLVIFIITTPQLSNDLEMTLPSAKKPKTPLKPPSIARIVVDINGKVTMNDKPFELPALKQTLTGMYAKDAETAVVVKGVPDTDYQYVVSVLDIIQQVGITKVGLATETASN
jgi:biopolymer transport protein ExbD